MPGGAGRCGHLLLLLDPFCAALSDCLPRAAGGLGPWGVTPGLRRFMLLNRCLSRLLFTSARCPPLSPTARLATERSPTSPRLEGPPLTGPAGSAKRGCRCWAGASCRPRSPSW